MNEALQATTRALALLTAKISDFNDDKSADLWPGVLADIEEERGPGDTDPAVWLAVGLMNLCVLLVGSVEAATGENGLAVLGRLGAYLNSHDV